MYCLNDFCCICFYNKLHLRPLSDSDSDNITYFIKLTSCIPEMCFNEMNYQRLICNNCCKTLDTVYKFRQRCLRSKTTLTDYISQLHQVSTINGAAKVYLIDINKFGVIKKELKKINNVKENDTFTNIDEDSSEDENYEINPITEIKRENYPISLKVVHTGHNYIQLGNVIIIKEQEDLHSEEPVEERVDNILLSEDKINLDISQNNINLANTIKKENKNQDFEEHLHKRFDNILKTSDNENDDIEVKVEETYDYSLCPEECTENPSTSSDGIINNIVDSDIETTGEINIQYKIEHIEEFPKEDNAIFLEDDHETDRDSSICLTAEREEMSTDKLSKLKHINDKKIKNLKSKQLNCNVCEKKFKFSTKLREHMKIHTREKPYECNICQKKFAFLSAIGRHIRMHTGEKRHKCSVCQKKFTESSSLKEHMRIHTGERPYECSVCKKKFTQSSSLYVHMQTHNEEKLFDCRVCQKSFTSLTNWKNHMRIHTGQKPHECSVCQKKFLRSDTLRTHIRIHTGEKPYECSVCQNKFADLSNLKRHIQTHNR